jgi:hypothetical protein
MRFGGLRIEGFDFRLNNGQRIFGTFPETGAQPVTVFLGNQPGFAINNLDCSLRTGGNTKTTAVTFLFIDLDDLPFDFHNVSSFIQ